ncbi:type I-C CRISPR-associated protein Cas8c/Csd1 [Selenomonas artemidis]|uniref:CRISPR-associated protein, Csd1 family n=1 Tax=Selenomonas artemidis F0399 TaxID=749551 RepID=E7N465_9FIRM|nr:type I-C CRISPR-associated protein Cas8c/Csd1 [Selenomonas artemidis]EFW29036.1 CRISPR-associated protein, Csd1 family [Selenomonas artemidis F0399]
MSWIEQLVQTYNENEQFAGRDGVTGMTALLPPVGHIVQNAQIEITVDVDGKLIHAEVVSDKWEQPTLIPCTPDSASRTFSPSPHPLHDNLSYIARDYHAFVPAKKKDQKSAYEQYKELLGAWARSEDADPKVRAVYRYITEHDAIHELIAKKVLYCNEKGEILQKWTDKEHEKPPIFKAAAGDLMKSMVRFRVELDGDDCPELWRDTALQKKYRQFFAHHFSDIEQKLCYATGKMLPVTDKHGKGIRFPGDGAKIISSNDSQGFTFRGRFADADECISIGYETSQKAMNALMWLIRNQGYLHKEEKGGEEKEREDEQKDSFNRVHSVGGRVFLAWGRYAKKIPSAFDDTARMMRGRRAADAASTIPVTMKDWATSMKRTLDGYRAEFKRAEKSQVNVMILDAATPGRLSICYYDEMAGEDFIERIEKWHTRGRWLQHSYDKAAEKPYTYFGVPIPKRLVEACYGENIGDNQLKMELERIFYAIVQGRVLPLDMMRIAFGRTVRRAALDEYYEWCRRQLEPSCSIICNRLNHVKEEYTVALDREQRDRSYLYGRLLAVADQIERSTFNTEDLKNGRTTNAMRYMDRFSVRPAATWGTLRKKLIPYERKIERYGGKERRLLNEITALFEDQDFSSNAPLDVKFLLGFSCQNYAMELARSAHKKKDGEKAAHQPDV